MSDANKAEQHEVVSLKQAIRDGDQDAAQAILNRAIQARLARVKPTGHAKGNPVNLTTINDKLDRVLELLDPNYERSSR